MSKRSKLRRRLRNTGAIMAQPLLASAVRKQLAGQSFDTFTAEEQAAVSRSPHAFKRIRKHLRAEVRTGHSPKPKQPGAKPRRYLNSFYRTEEWKRLRYQALVASDGRCQCCGASAKDGAVLRVDHVKPISKYPELRADPANHQVLCNSCNWGKGNWDETDWRYAPIMALGEAVSWSLD